MNKQLKEDLNDIRIKNLCSNIYYLHGKQSDTYIVYRLVDERNDFYSSNRANGRKYIIQVDVFSKGNYLDLVDTIESVLIEKGYNFTNSFDLYENDTGYYHKVLRFNHTKTK